MSLDLLSISLFLRVYETSNISLAGREFDLSPAAASNRLNELERSIGARLFHRTTRKITLSQEGEAFLPHARELLNSEQRAKDSVADASLLPSGLLRVACSASFGRQHIAPAIADFLMLYPDMKIDLRLSDTVIDMTSNAVDVAIRVGPLCDSSLIAKKLARNQMILCASPAYLQKHAMPNHPHDLRNHECLVLNNHSDWEFMSQQDDLETFTIKVAGRLQSDNGEALREAAINGLGIARMSIWNIHKQISEGSLIRVLPNFWVNANSWIWAAYLNRHLFPRKSKVFIQFLADRFSPKPYWESES